MAVAVAVAVVEAAVVEVPIALALCSSQMRMQMLNQAALALMQLPRAVATLALNLMCGMLQVLQFFS